nr:DUF1565 domain-containing protein [Candidatus Korarchaeota archaeon]NIU82078.1 DUF1565 domain-containing protein [Candidatus Thorarchaeota archaeon]NIW12498.1 DUF1565 domain-containing protein [Candidatus Thorarchaeota archaeon]NIW50712.1 DUF1565 domain-containing protein [Candidatus Korarchaeota archaeon]
PPEACLQYRQHPHTPNHDGQPPLHEDRPKDGVFPPIATESSATYWVEAGANGNGTFETPAGNITYILTNNASANVIINVQPGTYSTAIGETFPLNVTHYSNITLTSTGGPSLTTIRGKPNKHGLYVTANSTTIQGFTIAKCTWGIVLRRSYNTTIMGNSITNNTWGGIDLGVSNDSMIANNTIIHSTYGITVDDSPESTIGGNIITSTGEGIDLWNSPESTIHGNVMVHCGIVLWGRRTTFTTQRIAENNTVNGRSVYYYANQDMQGAAVPSDAGQVILGNVTGLTIEDVNVSGGSVGILLGYSSHITITNTVIANNTLFGVFLLHSTNTTITNSIIANNRWKGIWLLFTTNTTITNSMITNNQYGIELGFEPVHFAIATNPITSFGDSITVQAASTSNLVYRNNVFGNGVNAKDSGRRNAFNTSTVGNYWGDYNGTDANGDGIGDTPYVIPGLAGSKDYHPAMTPFALPPSPAPRWQSLLRFIFPIVILVVGIVLEVLLLRYGGGLTRLSAFIHHTQLKDIITTVTASLQRLWTDRDRQTLSVQYVLEATVDKLGTRLKGPLREEDKPDLLNLVRDAFYLLGKRFNVTWKDTWTLREYMSALIERAGSSYASLLREGYRHFEGVLYAERAEWRECLQAIHHVLVTITEKLNENPSSPTER